MLSHLRGNVKRPCYFWPAVVLLWSKQRRVVMRQFFSLSAPIFDFANSAVAGEYTSPLFGTGSDLFLHCKCDGGGWPARLIAPTSKFREQKSESQFDDASTQLGGWNFCFPPTCAALHTEKCVCETASGVLCGELRETASSPGPTPACLIYWK